MPHQLCPSDHTWDGGRQQASLPPGSHILTITSSRYSPNSSDSIAVCFNIGLLHPNGAETLAIDTGRKEQRSEQFESRCKAFTSMAPCNLTQLVKPLKNGTFKMIRPGPLLLSEAQWLLQATSPLGMGSPALLWRVFCGSRKRSKISKPSKKELLLIPLLSHCPERDRFLS